MHTLALTLLEQWGIVCGIVFPTLGVGWSILSKWYRRAKLSITALPSYVQSQNRLADGFYEQYHMVVTIKNIGKEPIIVKAWGMIPTTGTGPLATEVTGLPAKLDPFESVTITQWDINVFLREPQQIYAIDASDKKWYASRKDTREAVVTAKQIIQQNAARTQTPPSSINP